MEPPPTISADFARRMATLYGAEAEAWIAQLPALIADCAARWSLRLQPPLEPLSYNYVAPVTRADGTGAILKLCSPHDGEAVELATLLHFDGRGSVRVLEHDRAARAMLLERLRPGTPLSTLADDAAATSIAAGIMRELWHPVADPGRFPTVDGWVEELAGLRERFDGGTGPLPEHWIATAEGLFRDLLTSPEPQLLLHADLHHGNILAAERAPWLAIDPHGVLAERGFEVSCFIISPAPGADLARTMARRIDQFADELGLDRARLRAWSLGRAILSGVWELEEGTLQYARWLALVESAAAVPE